MSYFGTNFSVASADKKKLAAFFLFIPDFKLPRLKIMGKLVDYQSNSYTAYRAEQL